ncbi:unnamed protein product [Ilex paraguariensis]|uniref:Pectinesterase inhibitor domain-containing protein n=1 Tax=Ilex paraguariensis TaxID=185542 RepID=A0ABC8UCJ2_9AQUA
MRPFFFFLLLSLLSFTFHRVTANIIYETCRSVSKDNPNVSYSFCKTSLLAIPAAQCSNLQKLGLALINLIQKSVVDTMSDISKTLKTKKKKEPKKFYDVNQVTISIGRAASSCEDGFKDGGVASPLQKRDDSTSQLAVIALKIIDLYAKSN